MAYHGSAKINGVDQYAMQGPFYDPWYALSTHFKFDVEIRTFPIGEFKDRLSAGEADVMLMYIAGWFDNYRKFQIGR